jgi:L,D-transpeptidase catalytic domain
MGMLSNTKRFFVINLATMRIEQAGLVSHGRGQGASIFEKQYSNQPGSKSTSLGRYKISGKYKGSYGMSYRMVGLDSSNKNAYRRSIVLHSMSCIPDNDGVMPACVSEGCPALSTTFLSSLRKIIDSRKKPVLLWIFDSNLEEAWVEEKAQKEKFSGVDTTGEEFPACSNDSPR